MKQTLLISSFLALFGLTAQAQKLKYKADLIHTENDKVNVELSVSSWKEDIALFQFPKTIPGTYATEDYGVYIEDLHAFNAQGTELSVSKDGKNIYKIEGAKGLTRITYKVNDSFDSGIKKNAIFEPAGTSIEHDRCVLVNNCGFFGYFEGKENWAYEVEFSKPSKFYGATVLDPVSVKAESATYKAASYHELVDKPILFAPADTASFQVKNAKVNLAFIAPGGQKIAADVYNEMKANMEAISKFLPKLPVDRYTFIVYSADYKEVGAILQKPKPNMKELLKVLKQIGGKGFGALEHGNSSVYYLPDFGIPSYSISSQMKDVAIHEFMHIVTPLSLHSQHIGNFNYVNPIMSKHLWLYEGTTEYHAGLIQVRGDLITENNYFEKLLVGKIVSGERFPCTEMSFTEMSENVVKDKHYHKQYEQVYQRGAVMGMLLDLEIIRLTHGQKTLRDVELSLVKKYGATKSFDEDGFIKEFVAEVHPDLMKFFDLHISGKTPINYEKYLKTIGVTFKADTVINRPVNILGASNDVKVKSVGLLNPSLQVKKVGKGEWAGLMKGDILKPGYYNTAFKNADGSFVAEGTVVQIPIVRNGNEMNLAVTVKYSMTPVKNYIKNDLNKTLMQQHYYNVWMGRN